MGHHYHLWKIIRCSFKYFSRVYFQKEIRIERATCHSYIWPSVSQLKKNGGACLCVTLLSWYLRGVFKKYADRCCHSLSFWLKCVKLAHKDTQRILYIQWKFDTVDFKHNQTSVVMVTLVATPGPTLFNVTLTPSYPRVIIDCFFHIP